MTTMRTLQTLQTLQTLRTLRMDEAGIKGWELGFGNEGLRIGD